MSRGGVLGGVLRWQETLRPDQKLGWQKVLGLVGRQDAGGQSQGPGPGLRRGGVSGRTGVPPRVSPPEPLKGPGPPGSPPSSRPAPSPKPSPPCCPRSRPTEPVATDPGRAAAAGTAQVPLKHGRLSSGCHGMSRARCWGSRACSCGSGLARLFLVDGGGLTQPGEGTKRQRRTGRGRWASHSPDRVPKARPPHPTTPRARGDTHRSVSP